MTTAPTATARRAQPHASLHIHNPAPSPSDRAAAQLIQHLEQDTWRDILLNIGYLKYVPAALHSSPALRDCVSLFNSCWENLRRGAPATNLIDAAAYGRALGSLQLALQGPDQLSSETLAAVNVMERVEAMFSYQDVRRRVVHAKGIQSLLKKRGPTKLESDLDCFLLLETRAALVRTFHQGQRTCRRWEERYSHMPSSLRS
jgi:hypothetical protein